MDSTQSTESPKPIITVEIRTHGTTKPEIKDEFNNQVDTYFWKKKPQAKPIIQPQTKEAQIVKILLNEILARKTNKLSIFLEPILKKVIYQFIVNLK